MNMHVSIVIPVFNEARSLRTNCTRLYQFLIERACFDWEIVIANNGSTDRTLEIANELCCEQMKIKIVHLDQKGRGRALKAAWCVSAADIISYMDADLSTSLEAIPTMVNLLSSGDYDMVVGSRLLRPEMTTRCLKREAASRGYNYLLRIMMRVRFSDAQCGFKALTCKVAKELLPLVEDDGWFFDTELLVLAEKLGCRICDLPVQWVEGPDSRVNIMRTAADELFGLVRLWWRLRRGVSVTRSLAGC